MFAPTKPWRRWHRKININQKRYAVVSALAASAVPALVMARGHRIDKVPEVPLVLNNEVEGVEKTSNAVKVLKRLGVFDDVEKAKASRNLRPGKGKMRNRRYLARRGPLIVYGTEGAKIVKSFRNIPGVEVCSVDRLNLLQLAPGGHLGRFIVWTESAFKKLDDIFGTADKESVSKKGYKLPRAMMANADLPRIINSDEIQSIVRPPKDGGKRRVMKKNPLRNFGVMLKLNPYARTARRMELLAQEKRVQEKAEGVPKQKEEVDPKVKEAGAAWYQTMMSESDYTEFDIFQKWLGATQSNV